ncbi:MAG: N-acetylmuramoyl-L-alanine amidase [Candidatus Acidiferrales bacterium]
MRHLILAAIFLLSVISVPSVAHEMAGQEQSQTPAQVPAPPPSQPAAPPAQPQAASGQNPAPPPAPVHSGPVIVIDPAHGGTDNGARGQSGEVEKDVVLIFGRMLRSEFERQGYRVVMTRNDDSNPSYEDRAAVANAYRDSIFISLHVSSTGKVGTARAYTYQFAAPLAAAASPAGGTGIAGPLNSPAFGARGNGLILWNQAQQSFVEISHHLGDVLQGQLAQRFSGSPAVSTRVAVRELRSVATPAVAVEVSSVSVTDPNNLLVMGAPLAAAIVRGVQTLRPLGSAAANSSGQAGAK